jgi:protein-S-isoprenylcysteine O-methyltransferase Ste14
MGSEMDKPRALRKRTFAGLAQFLVALSAMLFLSAWSLRFWEGLVFWFEFSVLVTLITTYFLHKDPALIERRLKAGPLAEKQKRQKVIQWFANFFFVALIILPGIDHHLHWSQLSVPLITLGDILVAIGLAVIFFVFRENSYTSGVIEVGKGQMVISTGPYRLVRHPMYAGAIVLILGIPLALGSSWGLLLCLPMVAVIVWRLLDEEKYLSTNLAGYRDYCTITRYRLVPGIY